jgi:hypothetical protein
MATDKHLLPLSGGTLNLPVSLGEILGWKRMRKFKPRSRVIAALKKSSVLEVLEIDGKKTIRRHVPFTGDVKANDKARVVTINQKDQSYVGSMQTDQPAQVRLPGGYMMHNGVVKRMVEMSASNSELWPSRANFSRASSLVWNNSMPKAQ